MACLELCILRCIKASSPSAKIKCVNNVLDKIFLTYLAEINYFTVNCYESPFIGLCCFHSELISIKIIFILFFFNLNVRPQTELLVT